MPILKIFTNLPKSCISKDFMVKLIPALVDGVKKEADKFTYIIQSDCFLSIDGDSTLPAVTASLESIGHLGPEQNIHITKLLTAVMQNELGVKPGSKQRWWNKLDTNLIQITGMLWRKLHKMVGFRQEDTLTPSQKLIAGSISGVVTRFATQPLDVLKVKTQLQKKTPGNKSLTLYGMSKKMLTEEGITAFWHGHILGQVHSVLSSTSQFFVYEMTTKFVFSYPINPKYKSFLEFLCGITAGTCCATLVTPLEVIRVRQMLVKKQYGGLFNGAKVVYASGGIMAFFEGWTASVLMLGPQVGITFSVFSLLQPMILNYLYKCNGECTHPKANAHRPEHIVLASSIAGSVSGTVSKVATYPLDLAKRRLQIASHKPQDKLDTPSTSKNLVRCTNLMQCISDTVKMEGFFGLYRGFLVTVYKAQASSIVMFTTYEFVCFLLRK